MAWWVWALTAWALVASAAVVWLGFKLSMRVELLAELNADRDDPWGHSAEAFAEGAFSPESRA